MKKEINSLIFLTLLYSHAIVCLASEPLKCGIRSAHPLATNAGCKILEQGGNAFDAAIAVTSTLAVVEPFSSGIGGGGFFLLYDAASKETSFMDAREVAPRRSKTSLYVDDGKPLGKLSIEGATAAAIPGIPAALQLLVNKYGSISFKDSLASAIRIANQGFEVDQRYVKLTKYRLERIRRDPVTANIFLQHGALPKEGWLLKQTALSQTLKLIGEKGADVFYNGEIAKRMTSAVQAGNGFWEESDLRDYRVIFREPINFLFRGAKITTAPLPSSGGLVMAQVFQILEGYNLETLSEIELAHLVVEAMKRGYSDRAIYMGDPSFVDVPVEKLASKDYAQKRREGISLDSSTPSRNLSKLHSFSDESRETTHFSIVDKKGNMVSATLSINGLFGSAFTAGDTGVLLNNHMNDFVLGTGIPNMYGLVGTKANLIEPRKRPLSSMTPTFVEDKKGILIIGTPGGSRIISMVILGILDYVLNENVDAGRIVSKPRYHHQFIPDRIEIEPGGFAQSWIDGIKRKGHEVKIGSRKWGNMQTIFIQAGSNVVFGASDPRGR